MLLYYISGARKVNNMSLNKYTILGRKDVIMKKKIKIPSSFSDVLKEINEEKKLFQEDLDALNKQNYYWLTINQILYTSAKKEEIGMWLTHGLVRINESFEEWKNRFFINTKGYQSGNWNDNYGKILYKHGGIEPSIKKYVEISLTLNDTRIHNSMIYDMYYKDKKSKAKPIDLSSITENTFQDKLAEIEQERQFILQQIKECDSRIRGIDKYCEIFAYEAEHPNMDFDKLIYQCVRVGESFEDWKNRVWDDRLNYRAHMNDSCYGNEDNAKIYYEKGCIGYHYTFLTMLLKVQDSRLKGTVLYNRYTKEIEDGKIFY